MTVITMEINNEVHDAGRPILDDEEVQDIKKLLRGEYEDDGTVITDLSDQVDNLPARVRTGTPGCHSIFVDNDKLTGWIPTMRMKLKNFPKKTISEMDALLEAALVDVHGEEFLNWGHFHFRPMPEASLQRTSGFEDISSGMIGKMINVRGVVTAMSGKAPYPVTLVFECPKCKMKYEHDISNYSVYYPPPKFCFNTECAATGKTQWQLSLYESKYIDFRKYTVQEEPEFLKARKQPRNIEVVALDDISDIATPGSRVHVAGMLVATPNFNEATKQYNYTLFSTHLFSFNIESKDNENDVDKISDERREQIMAFVSEHAGEIGDYFKFLVSAVAPTIDGYELIKRGLLASITGGQLYIPTKSARVRPQIHVLLAGDPGTGKTAMIESMKSLCNRFEYASGQMATKAGLTAAVIHEDKEPVLYAGAVVIADGGICAVDEFEKLKEEDKTALHEQMEHGRITVRKSKFDVMLNARTTIIAAANPKGGRIVKPEEKAGMTIQKNLSDIPLSIQSRFDMIYLIEDLPNADRDKAMTAKMREARSVRHAKPMLDQTIVDVDEKDKDDIQNHVDFVRDLITLAKNHADDLASRHEGIGITDDAATMMDEYYWKMRAKCLDGDGQKKPDIPIPITPRQYGALDRIATAFAKLTFSKNVEARHVTMAIEQLDESMRQTLMDADGNIDAGMAVTGISKSATDKKTAFLITLRSMEEEEKKVDPSVKGVKEDRFKETIITQFNINEKGFSKIYDACIKSNCIRVQGTRVFLTLEGRREIE